MTHNPIDIMEWDYGWNYMRFSLFIKISFYHDKLSYSIR